MIEDPIDEVEFWVGVVIVVPLSLYICGAMLYGVFCLIRNIVRAQDIWRKERKERKKSEPAKKLALELSETRAALNSSIHDSLKLEKQREARIRWEENPDDHQAARFGFNFTGTVCGVPLVSDETGEICNLTADECFAAYTDKRRREYEEKQQREREERMRE